MLTVNRNEVRPEHLSAVYHTENPDETITFYFKGDTLPALSGVYLDNLKSRMRAAIDEKANALRRKVTVGITSAEMAGWSIKREEALKYLASAAATDAPMLSAEASARATTLDVLVNKVMSNASALSMLESQIAGVAGRHRDAINASSDPNFIANYDIEAFWPAI